MTLHLERAQLAEVPWEDLDARPDRIVTQTRAWLDFLVETQGVELVASRLLEGTEQVGWFTGAIVRRAGIKVLGSPMRGWTTQAMGFTVEPGVDVAAAAAALPAHAFGALGCWHLELADRALTDPAGIPPAYRWSPIPGYLLELGDDDALRAGFKRDARYNVGLAQRRGVEVEVVDPAQPGDFAAVYHEQVSEAFAKRGLATTYPVERVEAVIRHLGAAGKVLLLRARTADGQDAATGIFPFQPGGTAEYWMGGSFRRHQADKPNELLMWHALTGTRDRGAVRMDFGGGGTYKEKYGGQPIVLPWLRTSRLPAVAKARDLAYDLYRRNRMRTIRRATRSAN